MRERFQVQKLNKNDHKNIVRKAKAIRGFAVALSFVGTVALALVGVKKNK